MNANNHCPYCLAGVFRIETSRKVAEHFQQQYWRCPKCKRHDTRIVPRETIKPRRSRLEQSTNHVLGESP